MEFEYVVYYFCCKPYLITDHDSAELPPMKWLCRMKPIEHLIVAAAADLPVNIELHSECNCSSYVFNCTCYAAFLAIK